ncbi:hypothetical protein NMY22_g14788 [Coprinellus aureogranulatus]|nr:hypothetical protein NMY22_g14788 [Coprinellus aureogranulatus]
MTVSKLNATRSPPSLQIKIPIPRGRPSEYARLSTIDGIERALTRFSRAIIIGASAGGGAILLVSLAMAFFIIRDKRRANKQKERRERVIRRVRSMSESMFGFGGGMRGNTFMFPRRIRSSSVPGPSGTTTGDDEKVEEEPRSYPNHPYAFSARSSAAGSYIMVDGPGVLPMSNQGRPSSPSQSKTPRPTSLSQIQRDGPYQPRPSLGAQSSEEREVSPMRFSRYGYPDPDGYAGDPDRRNLRSLDIEGMLNMAAVQEDGGRSREGSVPMVQAQQAAGRSGTEGETAVPRVQVTGPQAGPQDVRERGNGRAQELEPPNTPA